VSASKLSGIGLTDGGTPPLSISYGQYTSDASVLAKISGSYGLVVSGAPASAGATLQADSRVTSFAVTGASVAQASTMQGYAKLSGFSISDAAAAVVGGLDGLASASKLSSIGLTDGGTPSLSISYGQYTSDASVLTKISGSYGLVVSGAAASAGATLQADSRVTSFAVTGASVCGKRRRCRATRSCRASRSATPLPRLSVAWTGWRLPAS
jgi:hypothetical protein